MNMTMDDLFKMIGKQQMVIEVLQAQNRELKNARKPTKNGDPTEAPLWSEAETTEDCSA